MKKPKKESAQNYLAIVFDLKCLVLMNVHQILIVQETTNAVTMDVHILV